MSAPRQVATFGAVAERPGACPEPAAAVIPRSLRLTWVAKIRFHQLNPPGSQSGAAGGPPRQLIVTYKLTREGAPSRLLLAGWGFSWRSRSTVASRVPHSRPSFGLEWGFRTYNRSVSVQPKNPAQASLERASRPGFLALGGGVDRRPVHQPPNSSLSSLYFQNYHLPEGQIFRDVGGRKWELGK